MHDPMTVAFEIRSPIKRKSKFWPQGYRNSLITIWHVDPEKDGSDDSCGWCFPNLNKKEIEYCERLIDNENDNLRSWFPSKDHPVDMKRKLMRMCKLFKAKKRKWYQHPRWHFWHWKIQIHFIQTLKRFLFSRCAECGKRFKWGYSPTSHSWSGTGPLWFTSEKNSYHRECSSVKVKKVKEEKFDKDLENASEKWFGETVNGEDKNKS